MPENPHKNKVHKVLAHSYSLFLIFFLVGVLLDLLFPLRIFRSTAVSIAGLVIVILASALIFWAQRGNRKLDKEHLSKETFSKGPYRYTSHPTHWGLFFLFAGFALMADAAYLLFFTILYFSLAHFTLLRAHDNILEEKYGEHYREYRESLWRFRRKRHE